MIGNEPPIEIESISVKQAKARDAACISNDRFFWSTPNGEIVAGESSRGQMKRRKVFSHCCSGASPRSHLHRLAIAIR